MMMTPIDSILFWLLTSKKVRTEIVYMKKSI